MKTLAQIEAGLEAFEPEPDARGAAQRLVADAETVLEHWVIAQGAAPTHALSEGSRLLALHRQGTRGVPSFNACRETCREIAFHYNILNLEPGSPLAAHRQRMMAMLVKHLVLFVAGKMQVEGLGDFCCASQPLRAQVTP